MSRKGFSLLEILIALVILIVGVAAIVNVFPVGLHASKRAADFTSIAILTQAKMAELMYLGYDHLGDIDGAGGMLNPSPPPYSYNTGLTPIPFPAPDDAYSWYMEIADVSGINNLTEVTLQIWWNDRGTKRYETFITYIAKRN